MKIIKVGSSLGGLGRSDSADAPDKVIKHLKNYTKDFDVDSVNVVKENIDETDKRITEKEGDVFIGGDHSITYSCFKNFSKKYKNPGLLIFDAHADCMDDFKITHEDWLRVLINEGFVRGEKVILVGLRKIEKNELDYIKQKGIKYFLMDNIVNMGDVCDVIMEQLRICDGLYISIDIDVIDPGFAPGTGYLEPGGLTSREMLYFIRRLKLLKNLKRVDVVEISPNKDINEITIKLGARIIYEFLK